MPDFFRDEETENRTHSLCLYDDAKATKSNRCKNCPRRTESRALYQQRRCPLDYVDIFSSIAAAAGQTSDSIDPKLLATSSKLQHGLEPLAKISDKIADEIADKIADISLDGLNSARKYRRLSRPDFDGSSPSMDMTACYSHVDVGDKRKAGQEPESSLRTELRRGGSKALWNGDLEKYYRNKPQIPFQDLCKDEPIFPRWSWIGSSPFEHASSRRCLTLSSDGTLQEEGHSLVDVRIPGVAMSTEGQGVAPCNDEVFLFRDVMVGEENSELSIDQIEERRIDGSV